MIEVSIDDVKRVVLDVQGLRSSDYSRSVLGVAKRIHNIQIDTISVVSRSHNLILFNRFPKYNEGDVWTAERQGKLFEYWSHAMCLLPMETFPYYSWKMQKMRERKSGWYVQWGLKNKDLVDEVFAKVKVDGATMSKDLGESKQKSNGWWDWKKEKRALEFLMTTGQLMVSSREGFQKSYDLPERVIPSGIDTEPMPVEDIPRYVSDVTFRSLGVGNYKDVKFYTGSMVAKHLWRSQRPEIEKFLDSLVGDILEEVTFGQKGKYYVHKEYARRLEQDGYSLEDEAPVKLLTPFDNILRERHYPKSIWDFDYKIECYVPKPDRKFGYFVLPILDQHELRGRVDAKVHRKTAVLELVALYLEDERICTDQGITRLSKGVRRFAEFHGCTAIKCSKVSPRKSSIQVRQLLEQDA